MEIIVIHFIILGVISGLTKGAGVLPAGPLHAAVGETVMFTTTVTPTETPLTLVTWDFDERRIIIGNRPAPEYEGRITLFISTGSLELRNVTLNDSGEYRVTIVPPEGAVKHGSITLEVHVPVSNVKVTVNSTDLVEFRSSVRLSCSSSGSPLSFLWMNGSSEVTASDGVQLTDGGSTLTIVNVTRYDQGPFRCRVFNPVSNGTSDPINLTIIFGPENINLTKSPQQEYFGKGSNISMSCSADSRPFAQFTWFLNGSQSGAGPELSLINIQESHSGNYSCQAFNSKTDRHETSQPSVVSVLERISGASITSPTNLIEGNSVNLTCEAAGSVFTRKWMKDGSDLILADNITLYDKNRVLSFNSLDKKDSGEYSCKISNPVSAEEAQHTMVVNYGPENVQVNGPSVIYFGKTLTLTCSAESTPSATYTWMLDGTEIHESSVFTKVITELSDGGNYTCQAMNNITGRTTSLDHVLTVKEESSGGLSAGAIAGITIACFVVVVLAGVGYYSYRKKTQPKTSSKTATRTGGEGQNNAAYSGSEELNYADIRFFRNKDGGTVELGSQNNSSEYAQVRVNNNAPAASSLPTYDVHMQRTKRPAPQPDANGAQLYAQVRKN